MKVKNGIASSRSLRDDAEQLVGEIAEEIGADQPELDADEAEEQADRGERECRRIADQHEDDQPPEHQGRHVARRTKSIIAAASRTRTAADDDRMSAAMRLMSSEMPCSAISAKPSGSMSLTGQRIRPPAFDDVSSMRQDSRNHGQVK